MKSTSRTAKAPARASAKPSIPKPGPGETLHLLTVPFEERALASAAGARWVPDVGWVYVAAALPRFLSRYAPKKYSWDAWLQDDLAGVTYPVPTPDADTGSFTLRRDQLQDMKTLLLARQTGAPEVIIGNDVGTGKTALATAMVKRMGNVRNVLVVAPLAVLPGWRSHLAEMGDGGKRWALINYESVKRLLNTPPSATAAKKTRTKNLRMVRDGTPRVQWDVVITDEAHYLGNPESLRSRTLEKVIAGPTGHPAFVIRLSATAGSDPAQLSYLHRGLFWGDGRAPHTHITADEYVQWCEGHNLTVNRSGYGNALTWQGEGTRELETMSALIFQGDTRWGVRRRPDWPEQQRFPVPVELTDDEMNAYEAEWETFQDALRKIERDKTTATRTNNARAAASARARGQAALIRYRQKAGQVRAAGTAEFAIEMLRKGKQVAISAEYIGTVNRLLEEFEAHKVPVATFTGQNPDTREEERIAYQRGEKRIIIYTPTEGFNLHAGETVVGGNNVPRITVVAEPRWSPKKALQAEGRSHRNGTNAPVYYTYAVGTVEEKVIRKVIDGMKNTTIINGEDAAPFDGLADALGVPFALDLA